MRVLQIDMHGMQKKTAGIFLAFLLMPFLSFSQEGIRIPDSLLSSTVVKIDTCEFSVSDFVWFYSKYNDLSEESENVSFSDYLNRFVEYKLKVTEAEYQQLDTTKAFRDEFFKYLKATAHDRMYRGAEQKREELVKLEYDRLHWDYEVAHIFVKSNIYDSPAAKKAAEEKIKQIHDEIFHAATLPDYTFRKCVQKYSDDNLSKEYDGNVGFITAMVSPFEYEDAVYNANVGDMVTARTAEGWYLINILQKRPTKGAVDAAIIMIYPQSEDEAGWNAAKMTIDSVYEQLQAGVPFDTLSDRYNLNERLKSTKGVIGLIDNGMPYSREIKETLFGLENDGDYSKPLKLPYGYAIVKRRWVLPLPGFEAYKTGYEKRIAGDQSRNAVVDNYYEEQMKQKLGFRRYDDELEKCMSYVDASILLGKWTAPQLKNDAVLFEIADEKYMRSDFFQYLEAIQKNRLRNVYDKDMLVRIRFDDFIVRRLELAMMKDMEKNDKEFQYIMQEYHDGMIVYDLMNREVFRYAEEDTVGMKFYYNQHKEQYMTEPRRESVTFTCDDEKTVAKVMKLLNQQDLWYNGAKVKDADKIAYYEQKGTPQMYIINTIASKNPNAVSVDVQDKILRHPEDVLMTITLLEEDDEGKMAFAKELKGISDKILVENNTITVTYYYFGSRQQTIKEAKEQLLMDYRKEIETQWMKTLYKRHSVQINDSVVENLKQYL